MMTKLRNRWGIIRLAVGVMVGLVMTFSASAVSIVWTNSAGGAWSEATNWNPNLVPIAGDTAIITNAGTYTVTLDVETTIAAFTLGTDTGTGKQSLYLGGPTLTMTAASTVNGSGVLVLAGSTLTPSSTLTIGGTMNWTGTGSSGSGGVLTGDGSTKITATGVLNIDPASAATQLTAHALTNYGKINFISSGDFAVDAGAVIYNQPGAVFECKADGNIVPYADPPYLLINAGTFKVSSGTLTLNITFTNFGTVDLVAGDLNFGDLYVQTAGQTLLEGGALDSSAGNPVQIQGGILAGYGVITSDVLCDGELNPGVALGALEINGNFTQSSKGKLNVEIGGATAGTSFDLLTVDGVATLGGALQVTLTNNYAPPARSGFQFLTAGTSLGGTFGSFLFPSNQVGMQLVYNISSGTVTVGVSNVPPVLPALSNYTAVQLKPFSVTNTAADADLPAQTLTYVLLSAPTGMVISASGVVTWTPALAQAPSTNVVTTKVTDNGVPPLSTTNSFTVTVSAVNQPPTFTLRTNQVIVPQDAGAQTFLNLATNVSPGSLNEATQTVAFLVSNNRSNLFTVQPTIAANGTLTFTSAFQSNGLATVTVFARDNGGTNNGGSDTSATQTFSIIVLSNTAPLFTLRTNNVVVGQAAVAQAVTNSGFVTNISGGTGELLQAVTNFFVSNNNSNLFSVQPAIATNGTLTFTPAANSNGTATVSFYALDNGGTLGGGTNRSATSNFTLTVSYVNQPPTFTLTTNALFAPQDAGPQTVLNLATNISPGPAVQATQTVNFLVSNNNSNLFNVQPTIATNGTLTFQSTFTSNGLATVTVYARNNGGTNLGGNDTSAGQTFSILIRTNTAPTFTFRTNNVVVNESATALAATNNGFVTNILAGTGEILQSVTNFVVSNNNSNLFSVQPAIATNGMLTFTPAAFSNGTATVTFYALDNGGFANGGTNRSASSNFTLTVVSVNQPPTFTLRTNSVNVPQDAGAQTVLNLATNISPGAPNQTTQAVNFLVSNNNSNLFLVQPAIATNGTLSFLTAFTSNGLATVTVYAHNNGGTNNGGIDTSPAQTFSIVVRSNAAPSFTLRTNLITLNETNVAVAVTNVGLATNILAGTGEILQSVTNFVTSNNNSNLFTVQPVMGTNGSLTFTPAAYASGTATVTLYALDSGGTANGGTNRSASTNLTLTINFVNQPPSFTLRTNAFSLAQDAGAQTVLNLATNISPGPNQSNQLVNFIVSNNNSKLFLVQPAIATNGTLTYQSVFTSNGLATVTVWAHNNGGTTNGGVDTSAAQTFSILIRSNSAPSFTLSTNSLTVNGSAIATAVTNSGFVTNILTGAGEVLQSITNFLVSNNNSNLFKVQPLISTNGTLTFTPAAYSNGTATVTLYALDDGGTFGGGTNRSFTTNFTLTVNAVGPVTGSISYQVSGGGLTLSWPTNFNGWFLVAQTNAPNVGLRTNAAAWIPVTGSNTSNTWSMPLGSTNGSVFFHLKAP